MAYVTSFPPQEPKSFVHLFPGSTPEELDLLSHMLQFNPSKRATLDELLELPYFDSVRQPDREILATDPLELPWDFDPNVTCDDLRAIFRHEIASQFVSSSHYNG